MPVDIPTLMLASGFVSALCAAFLLFLWWQAREPAALSWAVGNLAAAFALNLLAFGFVAKLAQLFLLGLTLLLLPPFLLWSGIRVFYGLAVRPLPIAAAFVTWLLALAVWSMDGKDWMPIAISSLLIAGFNAAAVYELLRHDHEQLAARVPLITLGTVNAVVFLLAIPGALAGNAHLLEPPPLESLFGLVHFEGLLYTIGTAIFLATLMKERSAQRNLHDAQTDALTGLSNRRAFLPLAERAAERCRRAGEPLAVIVFDLDRFKLVNDTYGHPSGDEVLKAFARVARSALRPGDFVSRVGGEEFFALLPVATLEVGCTIANRVRQAFEDAEIEVKGRRVKATVSAGVMASENGDVPLPVLIEAADAALYRAKLNGRNRVECGLKGKGLAYPPRLVRVA